MSFSGDSPEDSQSAIMAATYTALCEHGYAALSMAKIADELTMSKSSLYYHYDDKDDLLSTFLGYVIEEFATDVSVVEEQDANAQLRAFFDRVLPRDLDESGYEFHVVLLELRAQAPHHESFREQFDRIDGLLKETIAGFIETGIEQGQFRAVDPNETARLLVALIRGGRVDRVSRSDRSLGELRDALDAYLDSHLLA
ncbi:TetR/AcrR family transcriptional regulator [Halocatena halophila]|uniref:TetR/AcrR family transcriptional regulator n=1 Tax=Halocatena halophila TaxID=2814576 RepID=UPI002ED0358F